MWHQNNFILCRDYVQYWYDEEMLARSRLPIHSGMHFLWIHITIVLQLLHGHVRGEVDVFLITIGQNQIFIEIRTAIYFADLHKV